GQIDNIDGFLDDITLMDYLTCKVEGREFQYVKRKNFYTYETKIGIAREKTTLTSKEGHLYRIPMIRLKDDVGILVKISGIAEDIPQEGIL
ncbi:MAG: type III-B CRISPR module-associated Cmr3 family protein, partial [Candidatus Hydrothermales bacterium]